MRFCLLTACRLDFSGYPYRPIGGCNRVQESLSDWNIFPQTSCCQEALVVYARALALQAKNDSSGTIFIGQDQWSDCGSAPFQQQSHVSIYNCSLDKFYYGSGACSTLRLSDIPQNVTDQCSMFGSSLFDDACGACTAGISETLDPMLKSLNAGGNDTERATCLVSLVVAVIARKKINEASDDFERCLPALAGPGWNSLCLSLFLSLSHDDLKSNISAFLQRLRITSRLMVSETSLSF